MCIVQKYRLSADFKVIGPISWGPHPPKCGKSIILQNLNNRRVGMVHSVTKEVKSCVDVQRRRSTPVANGLMLSSWWHGTDRQTDGRTDGRIAALDDAESLSCVGRAGDVYYKFDDETDRVVDGYPRRISHDFGPRSDSTDAVPDNLDAAWFDSVSSLLYFFKGEWVRRTDVVGLETYGPFLILLLKDERSGLGLKSFICISGEPDGRCWSIYGSCN